MQEQIGLASVHHDFKPEIESWQDLTQEIVAELLRITGADGTKPYDQSHLSDE
jgi:hypothetical protein